MTTYTLRIDFDKQSDAPERVFHAMALYIEGFNEINSAFARGLGKNIDISTSLSRTPEGSLMANIQQVYKDVKQKLNVNMESFQSSMYDSLRDEISTLGKVDSENDVSRFIDSVNTRMAANDKDYNKLICQSEPNAYKVATGLNKLDKAAARLKGTDYVEFGGAGERKKISKKFSCPRTAEQIFSDRKKPFPSTDVLLIRKPDYVEDSTVWVFENVSRKQKSFHATMNAQGWVNDWREHREQIWPNDALLAKVVTHYGKNKKGNDSYTHEVIEVVRVMRNDEVLQYKMDLGNKDE